MPIVREGIVTRHYLKCPYCPGSMDLDRRVCNRCGARPVAVLWEHDSPELALVAREHRNRLATPTTVPTSWPPRHAGGV